MRSSNFLLLVGLLAGVLVAVGAVPAASPSNTEYQIYSRSLRGNGASCHSSSACQTGLFCDHSKCSNKVGNGGGCYKDVGCIDGLCFNSKCLSDTVRPKTAPCTASNQCSTSNCFHGKCAAKAVIGSSCYKAANCISGVCGSKGKCVAVSATTTTTSSSTIGIPKPTTTTTPPTNPTTNPITNSGFSSSLDGYVITGNAVVTIGNEPSLEYDGAYAQAVIPSGGTFQMQQTLTKTAQQKRSELQVREQRSLLGKRQQTPTYALRVYRKVAAFSPPYEQSQDGTVLTPVCHIYFLINGEDASYNTLEATDDWFQDAGYSDDSTMTSFGVRVTCQTGASVTMLFDDWSYIYIPGYVANTLTSTSYQSSPTVTSTQTVNGGSSTQMATSG